MGAPALILTMLLSRGVPEPSPASPFDAVTANTWHTFADTRLANGDPASPNQAAYRVNNHYMPFYKGGASGMAAMWSYCGLTYASDRGIVIDAAGGGHAGYRGNESYKCVLESLGMGYLAWSMLTGPTFDLIPVVPDVPTSPSTPHRYQDEVGRYGPVHAGYPPSSHFYQSHPWAPNIQRVICLGCEYPADGDRSNTPIFFFDPTAPLSSAWEEQMGEGVADFPDGNFCAIYSPVLQKIVYHGAGGLYTYDPVGALGSRQAFLPGSGTGGNQCRSVLYDNRRDRLVSVPLGYNGVYGGLSYWDLFNLTNVQGKRVLPHGDTPPADGVPTSFFSGDDAIFTAAPPAGQGGRGPAGNPGFTYNSRKDRYVMWCGDVASDPPRTTKTLWEIHPDTWAMTQIEPDGDAPDLSQAATGGVTSTSFFYYAAQDVYLLFNAADRNVMALRC